MTVATEYSLESAKPTGLRMFFSDPNGPLYTAKLRDGRAYQGPTGRVIYPHGPDGDLAWVVTDEPTASGTRPNQKS